jgi:hypothetical protein
MATKGEVAKLKKALEEMSAEFRGFRDKVKREMDTQFTERTTVCAIYATCDPCIAWTKI